MAEVEHIRANAEFVIQQMRPLSEIDFGYNAASVRWLAGYIERQRAQPEMTPEFIDRLTQVLGSYLGECVIACYGGQWRQEGDTWAIVFSQGNAVFPFAKVAKQFANGAEDSISSFFEVIGVVFADHMKPQEPWPQPPRKPWWKRW